MTNRDFSINEKDIKVLLNLKHHLLNDWESIDRNFAHTKAQIYL